MRAVGYKKMLVNKEPSSPVFCRNENTQENRWIRNEKLICFQHKEDKRFYESVNLKITDRHHMISRQKKSDG
jgi:hypothetical protein